MVKIWGSGVAALGWKGSNTWLRQLRHMARKIASAVFMARERRKEVRRERVVGEKIGM
jgi:hypothetical protein